MASHLAAHVWPGLAVYSWYRLWPQELIDTVDRHEPHNPRLYALHTAHSGCAQKPAAAPQGSAFPSRSAPLRRPAPSPGEPWKPPNGRKHIHARPRCGPRPRGPVYCAAVLAAAWPSQSRWRASLAATSRSCSSPLRSSTAPSAQRRSRPSAPLTILPACLPAPVTRNRSRSGNVGVCWGSIEGTDGMASLPAIRASVVGPSVFRPAACLIVCLFVCLLACSIVRGSINWSISIERR